MFYLLFQGSVSMLFLLHSKWLYSHTIRNDTTQEQEIITILSKEKLGGLLYKEGCSICTETIEHWLLCYLFIEDDANKPIFIVQTWWTLMYVIRISYKFTCLELYATYLVIVKNDVHKHFQVHNLGFLHCLFDVCIIVKLYFYELA